GVLRYQISIANQNVSQVFLSRKLGTRKLAFFQIQSIQSGFPILEGSCRQVISFSGGEPSPGRKIGLDGPRRGPKGVPVRQVQSPAALAAYHYHLTLKNSSQIQVVIVAIDLPLERSIVQVQALDARRI